MQEGFFGSESIICRNLFRRNQPSMTAIAIAHVKTGLIIAADGYARWSNPDIADEITRSIETDTCQKIFPAEFKGRPICYAMTGLHSTKDGMFNLFSEVQKAISYGDLNKPFSTVESSFRLLSSSVNSALELAKADGRFQRYPEGSGFEFAPSGTIAHLFSIGYFHKGNLPSLVIVRFCHNEQTLAPAEIEIETPPKSLLRAGSPKILQLLDQNDPRFKEFYCPLAFDSPLEKASEWAESFIRACSSESAREIDPEICKHIGGHVHVASIKPKVGFHWIKPPVAHS